MSKLTAALTGLLKDASQLKTTCLINGEWIAADNGEKIEVFNPATGEAICTAPKLRAQFKMPVRYA